MGNNYYRIATLITCHNRKDQTLNTLEILTSQQLDSHFSNRFYVNDDGSKDGTYEAIKERYPEIFLMKSDGTRFWCRGMYDVFSIASMEANDFFFWVNDDTFLFNTTLSILLRTYFQIVAETGTRDHVIVGTTRDPGSDKITFGGLKRSSFWHPLRFSIVLPQEKPVPADTMNGNCVLIPRIIVDRIGILDPTFVHYKGDLDYGLRAGKAKAKIWVAPGILGICKRDNFPGTIDLGKYKSHTIANILKDPKSGLNPTETLTYVKRHGGIFWFLFWPIKYIAFVTRYFFFRSFHSD